jgi:hypothetical protein
MSDPAPLYGIIGEFPTPVGAVAAARQLREIRVRLIDAYTPYPVEELDEVLRTPPGLGVALTTLAGAVFGAVSSTFVQYWAAAIDYPINVGGRPYNSWPAFTVSSFEVTLLFAVIFAFLAFLASSRLPLLFHPVFGAADFARASQDRFFLAVEAADPHFDAATVRAILERHGAAPIDEVLG